jgi:hypothetical protein
MNLVELYAQTPVEKHVDIVVAEGRVFVRSAEGTEEYALLPDGEMELVRSDKDIRAGLTQIKGKLGI